MSEDNGNGKVNQEAEKQPEKTSEQLASERLARYQAEPNSFIEISELVCGVMKNPKSGLGVAVMVGHVPRTILDIAQVEINHIINKIRMRMDVESEMKRQATSIQKPGGIMNFAKGLRRK